MSGPYPKINRWIIPASVLSSTLAGVQPAGAKGNEAGAFWLGVRREITEISAVLLPSGQGVTESPYQWRVEPEVFSAALRWAKPLGLSLLAVVHTHIPGVPPKLSWADRYLSVQVPGILSVIVGNGGYDREPHKWGWYVYEDGDFHELNPMSGLVLFAPTGVVKVQRISAQGVVDEQDQCAL